MYKALKFPFKVDPYGILSYYKGTAAWLNSNDSQKASIIALGVNHELILNDANNAFDQLKAFYNQHNEWLFGYLGYDLKNNVEDLKSENTDLQQFPDLYFFQPKAIIETNGNFTNLYLAKNENLNAWEILLNKARDEFVFHDEKQNIELTDEIDKSVYLDNFNKLAGHIQRGDIYEVNYCIEFSAGDVDVNPLLLYKRLNEKTEAPFSVFYRSDGRFLLSGSPERYLKKQGTKLISQPIKGTIKRGKDEKEDELLKEQLFHDPKERSENVMIVDLVRNDLSRVAEKGSVKVDELFGVYSFKTVHHLISTISCTIDESIHPVDAIKATFPMGSMTGAPKISAMQLIEKHEQFKRGIYSGAFGCFLPDGDFDFNVVIRSIIYNQKLKTLSFPVGGAITSAAKGEQEYHECLLKAESMKKAIQNR
jgi:para-aminobenzoate synthetase component 1